eukprot:TRINITY_DN59255_c0_g1_i1.p1 TRINITY_DN59255_c0_g1~~TRINITY_DN59255_c0_g1_i1.p1  ORF type:complete len:407 (+),score=79.94 TRINITY_DN59255_c0_g1_i1:55-1221(+)
MEKPLDSEEAVLQNADSYFKKYQIRPLVTSLLFELAKSQPDDPISFMLEFLASRAVLPVPSAHAPESPRSAPVDAQEPSLTLAEAQAQYDKLGQLKSSISNLGKPVEAVLRARQKHGQAEEAEMALDNVLSSVQSLAAEVFVDEFSAQSRSCVEDVLARGRSSTEDRASAGEYGLVIKRCTQGIFADQKRLLQRIKDLKKLQVKSAPISPTASAQQPDRGPTSLQDRLRQQWFELELLLRSPIVSAEDWERTQAAASDARQFLTQLDNTARELGVLKGVLSRHLLPFDSNTDINDQSNRRELSPRSAAAMREAGLGALTEMEGGALEQRMIEQAVSLRRLVRVKLADDADVAQAEQAIGQLAAFCEGLQSLALAMGRSPHELLASFRA